MKARPIFLKVLWWCEMIVAALVLAYTMPALIRNYQSGSILLTGVEIWSLVALTLIALHYFATGLATVLGLKSWRWFHFLGSALTMALIFSFIKRSVELQGNVSPVYFIPVFISLVLSVFVLTVKDQRNA